MNPWDAVEELRFQYEQRIDETFLASRNDEGKRQAWRTAMERKGIAYRAYAHAVGEAAKSCSLCPW